MRFIPAHLIPFTNHEMFDDRGNVRATELATPTNYSSEDLAMMSVEQRRVAHQEYMRLRRNFLARRRRLIATESLDERGTRQIEEAINTAESRYEYHQRFINANQLSPVVQHVDIPQITTSTGIPILAPETPPGSRPGSRPRPQPRSPPRSPNDDEINEGSYMSSLGVNDGEFVPTTPPDSPPSPP